MRKPWRLPLGVLVVSIAAAWLLTTDVPASTGESKRPKLVVLLVFDQMRGDYLWRWDELFAKDGFRLGVVDPNDPGAQAGAWLRFLSPRPAWATHGSKGLIMHSARLVLVEQIRRAAHVVIQPRQARMRVRVQRIETRDDASERLAGLGVPAHPEIQPRQFGVRLELIRMQPVQSLGLRERVTERALGVCIAALFERRLSLRHRLFPARAVDACGGQTQRKTHQEREALHGQPRSGK